MNKIFYIIFVSIIFSQSYIDVLTLNNGDIIKGKIVENQINEYIRIELQGGSILTYEYSNISRIDVEEVKTRTFGSNNKKKQSNEIIKDCFGNGYKSGKQIDAQGALWGGFGSSLFFGLIGTGVSYAIVANKDYNPPLFETIEFNDASCIAEYTNGYNESASEVKKSSNLLGSALGIITLIIIATPSSY